MHLYTCDFQEFFVIDIHTYIHTLIQTFTHILTHTHKHTHTQTHTHAGIYIYRRAGICGASRTYKRTYFRLKTPSSGDLLDKKCIIAAKYGGREKGKE